MTRRVVVVGATGHIGRPLCEALVAAGDSVVVFSRDPAHAKDVVAGAADYVTWSPDELSAECAERIGSADAVVYLAGATLFDGRPHTKDDVVAETRARTNGMARVAAALRGAALIAASSVGFYGYAGRADAPVDETFPAGTDWWGRDSAAMEQAAQGPRVVLLRTGYVLTRDTVAAQAAQFHRHLGGWIGTGRGWTPWIHVDDEIGIIRLALESTVAGPLNLTAPQPVRAREFASVLGRVLGRRAWLPVPTPMVRMGMGVVTDIVVHGQRVVPAKATGLGYRFRFPALEPALRDLLDGGTR